MRPSAPVLPFTSGSWVASSAAVGSCVSAVPKLSSRRLRSARTGDCSAVRISSSWTPVEVRLTGIVAPLSSSGALGLPGSSSMKKLPSRKIRGRIAAKASSWIGRPLPSTVKVTLVLSPSRPTLDHFADVDAGDPHRRVGRDVDPVGEGGVERVAVAGEGDVFGEGQVGADREDEDEDQRDRRVARPPLEAAARWPRPWCRAPAGVPSAFAFRVVVVPQSFGDAADHGLARA